MLFDNVSILGLAHVDAPHIITSASLEERLAPAMERLGLRPNIIQGLTGIKERRFWDPGIQPSEVASLAGSRALESAGIDRAKIGVLISTSVCKDYIEPSVASLVHGNLRLGSHCTNFDISNACLAFLTGMEVAGNMIDRGQIDYALVVDGEGSRYIVDKTIERLLRPESNEKTFRANFATLTLGSGAGAMVLGRSDLAPEGHRLVGGVSVAATEHNRLCLGQLDEMLTDASKLLVVGIELAARTYAKAKEELVWKDKRLDELVLHQVSNNHTMKLSEALDLDTSKIFAIYPEFGNIGPAAIPIALSKSLEAGRISKGDRVALMGIGSGLNCAMMEVLW
jgi:3-oxoacyl-[acyl-carrier-protein] synthase III